MVVNNPTREFFNNPAAEKLCKLLRFDDHDREWTDNLSSAEWSDITANSIGFELAPLLYQQGKKFGYLGQLDPSVAGLLRQAYQVSSMQGLLRGHDLEIILGNFAKNNIPSILLKGSHLAEEIYRDPGLRTMVDLDILVHKEDLDLAAKSLKYLGYQAYRKYDIQLETATSHQLPIFLQRDHFPVEIHWNLISPEYPYKISLDGIWGRKREIKVRNSVRYVLAIEDAILHLAIHPVSQHKLTGSLRSIYDFSAALNAYSQLINWTVLKERASMWNASNSLFLMLDLAQNLFGIEAPEEFLDAIRPQNYDKSWGDAARKLIFVNPGFHPGFSRNLASFLSAPSPIKKIQLAFRRIFPHPEEIAKKFSVKPKSPSVWLNYPRYFAYLIKKHHKSLIKIYRGEKKLEGEARLAVLLQQREDYLRKVMFQ